MRDLTVASAGRVSLGCALGISVLAMVIGRICPEQERPRTRIAAGASIIEAWPEDAAHAVVPRLVDADQEPGVGTVAVAASLANTMISPVVSPWRDDRGGKQVIGYSWDGMVRGEERGKRRFGVLLARFPDGRALSFAPLESSGSTGGPLCWLPGTLAQVIFAGRDGSLYRVDFERSGADDTITPLSQPTVRKIAWRAALPPCDVVYCNDPAWPGHSLWSGRLIVALRHSEPNRPELTPWRLWWLKPDSSNTAIVAAGPLFPSPSPDSQPPVTSERFPSVAVTRDGSLRVAFLARTTEEPNYQLQVARLRLDRNGEMQVVGRGCRPLIRGCGEAAPVFSSDGNWVCVTQRFSSEIRRVALTD